MNAFQTFEFVTAKFERQSKKLGFFSRFNPFSRNEPKMEWVLREQTLTTQRLVEKLSKTVRDCL